MDFTKADAVSLIELEAGAGETQGATPGLHVLVCPDRPQWAFDNIAKNIALYAGPNRLSKLYMIDVLNKEHLFFEALLSKRIDICHIFWREDLFFLLHPSTIAKAAMHFGLDYRTLVKAINNCAFTTSVYDHLFSSDDEMQARRNYFAVIDGYTVASEKLFSIYDRQPDFPPPDAIITDGVDVEHFSPADKRADETGTFKIGWVGNSAWGNRADIVDVKGYHRWFEPMFAELLARGLDVEKRVADPQIRRIPFEEMPDFYRDLDVFVCTSAMEGTPNTVLEAMACGIPIVSTDVGIVPMAFGAAQKEFIVQDPNATKLADAVSRLLGDAGLRRRISRENRSASTNWSWKTKTRDWWPFWEATVRRSMTGRAAIRREMYLLSQF